MRSRSNGGVIGAYSLPTQNGANGVFFIHDAAIYNTGTSPIWPLSAGLIYNATGGVITDAVDNSNYKLHTFTANGTFTVTSGTAYIDVFLVGGGGSIGYIYYNTTSTIYVGLGGGGGGAVTLVESLYVNDGTTFTVEIGQGGNIGSYGTSNLPGVPGSASKITSNRGYSVIAKGGGAGGGNGSSPTSGGGGGGGYARYSTGGTYNFLDGAVAGSASAYTVSAGANVTVYAGYAGGSGDNTGSTSGSGASSVNAGGGGGAGGPGYAGNYAPNTALSGYGGDGVYYNRTAKYYGAGGAGGSYSRTTPRSGLYSTGLRTSESQSGPNGFGVGASGTQYLVNGGFGGSTPQAGGDGVVIFCYRYK